MILKILVVFGMSITKMVKTKKIIVKIFKFYDVKRHRFCTDDKNLLCLKTTLKLLCKKCDMTAIEAEVTYKVLKVVVKAFYCHTPQHSIRNPIHEAMVLKKESFAWKHAAHKIARYFRAYVHIFYYSHPDYENLVQKLFEDLYEKIKARASPVVITEFFPNGSIAKRLIEDPTGKNPSKQQSTKDKCNNALELWPDANRLVKFMGWNEVPQKHLPVRPCKKEYGLCSLITYDRKPKNTYNNELKAAMEGVISTKTEPPVTHNPRKDSKTATTIKKMEMSLPRCLKCNAPKLLCFCNVDKVTGVVAVDCSQGPYQCQWVLMTKPQRTVVDEVDGVCRRAEYHQCPIDCENTTDSDFTSLSSDDNICDECDQCSETVNHRKRLDVLVSANTLHDSSDDEDKLYSLMKKDLPGSSKTKGRGYSVGFGCAPCNTKNRVPPLNIRKRKQEKSTKS